MYIAPETNVKILRNVPLDESYEHTVHFGDSDSETGLIEAQTRFFNNYVAYNLTEYTYQRLQRGYIRVGIKAELLYNCNYLMYQNTAFGNKWFYAFITGIEYINNEVSEIEFEIDVMQTWMFDYKLERCFVSRMTPATDYIGENIVPEPLDIGEPIFNDYTQIFPPGTSDDYRIMLAICDVTDATVSGKIYDGIYGGATLYAYRTTTADILALNTKIASYVQKPDAVLALYYVPGFTIPDSGFPANHELASDSYVANFTIGYDHVNINTLLDGYKPKNCKLYTYPFNYFSVISPQGGTLTLRYEFFHEQEPYIAISSCLSQPITTIARPAAYKGTQAPSSLSPAGILDTESISLNNYPICSWNTDMFKAWVAQNAVPTMMNLVRAAIPVATPASKRTISDVTKRYNKKGEEIGKKVREYTSTQSPVVTPAQMGFRVLDAAVDAASDIYSASIEADIIKGSISNGNPLVAAGRLNFFQGRMSVNYQHARIIDEFLTRFGYAQNRYIIPTKHNRPYWTYLKTAGCTIHGSIPGDDAAQICQIHDGGCLFLDPQFVTDGMDFTKDNSPGAGLRGYDPDKIHNGYNPDA